MKRNQRLLTVTLGLTIVAFMGFACWWNPHFTHSNADSPLLMNNYIADGQAAFNKNIYPGHMCVGALNTATGEGADTYLELYMNVGDTLDLEIYDPDDDTYYNLTTSENGALQALKKHVEVRPNINVQGLTLTVDNTDTQHPVFKVELADFMDSQHGEGTIWQFKINHMSGNTCAIRRVSDSACMPDDRIGYVRQGGTVVDCVDLTAATFNGNSTDTTPDWELTFEREMGAIYSGYVSVSDPDEKIAAFAWDRTHPGGGGLTYKFINSQELTPGAWYYFVLVDRCNETSPPGGCVAGMAASQDMHGNPITTTLSGWTVGDASDVIGGETLGLDVLYYQFQVRY